MTDKTHIEQLMTQMAQQAKQAATILANATTAQKNQALTAMADQLLHSKDKILAINTAEVERAQASAKADAFVDRLQLTPARFDAMVAGVRAIAGLPDPVGRILARWDVPSGLNITRLAVPIGVIGVIYEARPNVTADAASLCLKSGNAVILRGGSECADTNKAIADCLQQGLVVAQLPEAAIQYVPEQSREAVSVMITLSDWIDVIIPRGGKSLIERLSAASKIPIFKHLEGICHTYIHQDANLEMASEIIVNAKLRRPGICGATETLLIDQAIAASFLPPIIAALRSHGCDIRGDAQTQAICPEVHLATEVDWSTEYLSAIIAIRVVKDFNHAIEHIRTYSSQHTDAIVTANNAVASKFFQVVDSAIVMHNCSTQFADGGEFGMGAEIGIATGKLHARGPVGLEQLTTFKYVVAGTGQVRAPAVPSGNC